MTESNLPPDKCFVCEYMERIPGDAHVKCVHPLVKPHLETPLAKVAPFLGKQGYGLMEIPSEVTNKLKITAIYTGIIRGWFDWPFNFDPMWLSNCRGFKRKE